LFSAAWVCYGDLIDTVVRSSAIVQSVGRHHCEPIHAFVVAWQKPVLHSVTK